MAALRQHRYTATLFVILSLADVAMTAWLLAHPSGGVYEANGLARAVLIRYGVAGLAAYKGLLVLLTCVLVGVVAAHRPAAARRLSLFACAAVGVVVLYSCGLLLHLEAHPPAPGTQDLAVLRRERERLQQYACARAEFVQVLDYQTEALAAGRCTLPEALAALGATAPARDPAFMARYRSWMGAHSDRECLAAMTAHAALVVLKEDPSRAARTRTAALLADYRAEYGAALVSYVFNDVLQPDTPDLAEPAVAQTTAPRATAPRRGEGRSRFDPRRAPRAWGGPLRPCAHPPTHAIGRRTLG